MPQPATDWFDDAVVLTNLPGRLRLKLSRLYRSSTAQKKLEQALQACPHIIAVYANPLTAHILILFDLRIPAHTILKDFGLALPPKQVENQRSSVTDPAIRP